MKYPTWYVVMRENEDRELEPLGGVYATPEEAVRAAVVYAAADEVPMHNSIRRRYVPYKCAPVEVKAAR